MDWIVLGSSPIAPLSFTLTRQFLGDNFHQVITCNAGIHICRDPDVYFAVDHLASQHNREAAIAARKRSGTLLCTLHRVKAALEWRKVHDYDVHLKEGEGRPKKGGYGRFRYSGPLCIEWACNHGARRVFLCGMDGYRPGRDAKDFSQCYFDHEERKKYQTKNYGPDWARMATRDIVAPATREIVEAWDDVQFILVGDPAYRIDAPNWQVWGIDAGETRLDAAAPEGQKYSTT